MAMFFVPIGESFSFPMWTCKKFCLLTCLKFPAFAEYKEAIVVSDFKELLPPDFNYLLIFVCTPVYSKCAWKGCVTAANLIKSVAGFGGKLLFFRANIERSSSWSKVSSCH